MALASVIAESEAPLRADLQQYFGIDLDRAMGGEHSAVHIALLVTQLPQESRLVHTVNKDAQWTLPNVLMAVLINNFRMFVYGMSDPKRRGAKPELIGPSWMTENKRTLPARVLPIDKLLEELSKPRRSDG